MVSVSPIEIIAEIGVNHNGNLDLAMQLIEHASRAGATTVKFQLFKPNQIASARTPLANYQRENGVVHDSQLEMLGEYTLDEASLKALHQNALALGLEFLVTPFDLESLRFLKSELQLARVKVASGDLTFHQLIFEAARLGLDLIISTGMATKEEVGRAIDVALMGRGIFTGTLKGNFQPSKQVPQEVRTALDAVKSSSPGWMTIMHCTSTYPAPDDDLNIQAIRDLQELWPVVGYSDHSLHSHGAVMAIALGARIFEKHITLAKGLPGPDHAASLDLEEFSGYVDVLQKSWRSLGNGAKVPQMSEIQTLPLARRSLYARKAIRLGEIFTSENVIALRPIQGMASEQYFDLIGMPASKSYAEGDSIDP